MTKTMTEEQREKKLASKKRYRDNNKDRISIAGKKYYREKKDLILERQKGRYASDPEPFKKLSTYRNVGWEDAPQRRHSWRADDEQFLIENEGMLDKDIAKRLGRSVMSISIKRSRLIKRKRKLNDK